MAGLRVGRRSSLRAVLGREGKKKRNCDVRSPDEKEESSGGLEHGASQSLPLAAIANTHRIPQNGQFKYHKYFNLPKKMWNEGESDRTRWSATRLIAFLFKFPDPCGKGELYSTGLLRWHSLEADSGTNLERWCSEEFSIAEMAPAVEMDPSNGYLLPSRSHCCKVSWESVNSMKLST